MDDLIQLIMNIPMAFYYALSYVTIPEQRIFWLYLLSAFLIAGMIFLSASKKGARPLGIREFLKFCFPGEVWKNPSAQLDVRFFVVGQAIYILVFTLLSGLMALVYFKSANWSNGFFGSQDWVRWEGQQPGLFSVLGMGLLTAMIIDLAIYCMHYLQHRWSFLWEFHKVHHSAAVMHPLTNYREHIVDNLLYVPVVTGVTGLISGFLQAWYPGNEQIQFYILGIPLFTFIYNFFGYNLRHSHIWLAWPPVLGRIFGSPANHQIHHSREARHIDKNFGFIFACWDWMFGTLYLPPREREDFSFGLADGTEGEYSSILRLYTLPFMKLYQKYSIQLSKLRG